MIIKKIKLWAALYPCCAESEEEAEQEESKVMNTLIKVVSFTCVLCIEIVIYFEKRGCTVYLTENKWGNDLF